MGGSGTEKERGFGQISMKSIIKPSHREFPGDLRDAKKCLEAGVYSATAVMCGRVLEGIVREKCSETNLARGLAKLRDLRVIDDRLFEWSELLRKERNLGAHSSEQDVTKENAQDLYEFAQALCEFIYILSEKYTAFVKRKGA